MAGGITQIEVDQAADDLLRIGERPTIERIRQQLGTGSPNTVTRMLDAWWKTLGPRLAAQQRKLNLPDAPESVATLASQLWELSLTSARELADVALKQERDAMTNVATEAEASVTAAHEALKAARDEEAQAVAALAAAHERFDDQQRLVAQQTGQLEDLARQRDEALRRNSVQEAEAAALRTRLEALQFEMSATLEAHAAHLRAVEDRAHGEIDRARQESREAKQQRQAAEKAHTVLVKTLEADLGKSKETAAQVARDLAAEQGRRETLEAQQIELRRSLESVLAAASEKIGALPRKSAKAGRKPRVQGAAVKKTK